jgi:poly(3-hydroxybutyrate) depolymerase
MAGTGLDRRRAAAIIVGAISLIPACTSRRSSSATVPTTPVPSSVAARTPTTIADSTSTTAAAVVSRPAAPAAADPTAWVRHDPTATLPPLMPHWNLIDRGNWSTCRRGTDQSVDKAIVVAGDPIPIPGYPGRPTLIQLAPDPNAPMIVVFHAFGGCIANMQKRTDLDAIAAGKGVSMLWLSGAADPDRTWHPSMDASEPYHSQQADDFAYIDAVFTALHAHGIVPRRVVSVGISNGAGMAITAACLRPNWFDGAISVAGWLPLNCARAPLSVLAFNGGKDPEFNGTYARTITGHWLKNVVDCPNPAKSHNSGFVFTQTWSGCTGDSIVRLVILPDANHVWPKFTYYDIDTDILNMALGSFPDDHG